MAQDGREAEARGAWLDSVRRIVAAVRASEVTDFELDHGDFHVRVRRAPQAVGVVDGAPAIGDPRAAEEGHLHRVSAPFTGVFYRAPTPSAKPYVIEGDWVDADTVIGLVETMKIFNEVTADRSGRVVAFQAQSGQLVHVGDALVLLEPSELSVAEPELRA